MSDRRIVVFDVETTGTDKQRDQIIELCVQFGVESNALARTWRFRPEVSVSAGAEAVHGISTADLADCPRFAEHADDIRRLFDEAQVLVGYNLSFDIDMVQAELARLRQPPIDLSGKHVVDPFRLWQQCEPRSLQDAHRRFVGQDFDAAHSASADVAATGRVLRGMVSAFGLDPSWRGVAEICEPDRANWIGPSRHLQWDERGRVAIGFGRHAGVTVAELAGGDDDARGYLRWILDRDFPAHVEQICRAALELGAPGLELWVRERFGDPPADRGPESHQQPPMTMSPAA